MGPEAMNTATIARLEEGTLETSQCGSRTDSAVGIELTPLLSQQITPAKAIHQPTEEQEDDIQLWHLRNLQRARRDENWLVFIAFIFWPLLATISFACGMINKGTAIAKVPWCIYGCAIVYMSTKVLGRVCNNSLMRHQGSRTSWWALLVCRNFGAVVCVAVGAGFIMLGIW